MKPNGVFHDYDSNDGAFDGCLIEFSRYGRMCLAGVSFLPYLSLPSPDREGTKKLARQVPFAWHPFVCNHQYPLCTCTYVHMLQANAKMLAFYWVGSGDDTRDEVTHRAAGRELTNDRTVSGSVNPCLTPSPSSSSSTSRFRHASSGLHVHGYNRRASTLINRISDDKTSSPDYVQIFQFRKLGR